MTVEEHARRYPEVWRRFSPRQTLVRYAWYAGIVFVALWSVRQLEIPWLYFLDAHVQAADLLVRMFPPDWAFIEQVLDPLIETIHIATLGTAFTFIIAFPIAFLSARNTTYNDLTWLIGRFILVTSRSVNTVVWGLVFVAIFGPGPVAGIWAITARSIGFMGKLIAEAIEEVDEGTIEAIEATGASRLQVLWIGVLPQVLPIIWGTSIYRWDINIRESTVLGFVGAGGIGIILYSSINLFAWSEVGIIIISIFVVVVFSEFVSAAVRQRIT
ncbi:MAG: phosphonate ABC transporter, permease protein PhnE [Proteobacteria bacterium]|nr:phosphonate ABC transporter, permease protein PhnE [Pseudomonadota bacterium]MCH8095800.1 phosphonate ABC transporter, permease protein PhnE [Pseudomonadota bacterium]